MVQAQIAKAFEVSGLSQRCKELVRQNRYLFQLLSDFEAPGAIRMRTSEPVFSTEEDEFRSGRTARTGEGVDEGESMERKQHYEVLKL